MSPIRWLSENGDPLIDEETIEVTMPFTKEGAAGPPAQEVPTLSVVAGPDMLHFVTILPGEQVLVGRDDSADLRLSDITVSKRHARFEADEEGGVMLVDLGSTNGTRVRDTTVHSAQLRPGDLVELGNVLLRLEALSLEELTHRGEVISRLESVHRDPLTGLLTRAVLDDDLDRLVKRSDAIGLPLSCVFIDIDDFKLVNDRFGHAVGDDVLSAVARLVMLHVRDTDPAIRYGGEEFLVVLPGSTRSRAVEVAQRIRKQVADHDWFRNATDLHVSVSLGVAERLDGEPIRDWLSRADQAMYSAKQGGKNRVFVAD